MGLKSLQSLRAFCLELSSAEPSPGGGTAAAAAGAMSASLLVMVCGITAKSKKHAAKKKDLETLVRELRRKRDALILLARQDARAYDSVVHALKRARRTGDSKSAKAVQKALKHAAEVPLETATLCIDVLERAVTVAEMGKRSASSDVGVAVHLADVGYKGAAMNVRINVLDLEPSAFVKRAVQRLMLMDDLSEKLKKTALALLQD